MIFVLVQIKIFIVVVCLEERFVGMSMIQEYKSCFVASTAADLSLMIKRYKELTQIKLVVFNK